MTVDLYYDSSLGDDAALMESMQMNAVTFALVGPAGIAPMCPIYEFFDLPCLFATRDAAYAFQESEPVLELMDSLSAMVCVDWDSMRMDIMRSPITPRRSQRLMG